jgi:hypothetical protein
MNAPPSQTNLGRIGQSAGSAEVIVSGRTMIKPVSAHLWQHARKHTWNISYALVWHRFDSRAPRTSIWSMGPPMEYITNHPRDTSVERRAQQPWVEFGWTQLVRPNPTLPLRRLNHLGLEATNLRRQSPPCSTQVGGTSGSAEAHMFGRTRPTANQPQLSPTSAPKLPSHYK